MRAASSAVARSIRLEFALALVPVALLAAGLLSGLVPVSFAP
jgi:hypothetical protein